MWPSNTLNLGNALRQLKVTVDVRLYPNRGHADTVAALAWVLRFRSATLKDIAAFIAVGSLPLNCA
ncbi:MAG: hypothetical protein WDM77_09700 [Steroidobacteraceae bacterium]